MNYRIYLLIISKLIIVLLVERKYKMKDMNWRTEYVRLQRFSWHYSFSEIFILIIPDKGLG